MLCVESIGGNVLTFWPADLCSTYVELSVAALCYSTIQDTPWRCGSCIDPAILCQASESWAGTSSIGSIFFITTLRILLSMSSCLTAEVVFGPFLASSRKQLALATIFITGDCSNQ